MIGARSFVLIALLLAACASPSTAPQAGPAGAQKCTACGKPQLVPVLYGLLDAEGMAMVERGEVVSGGCDQRGPSHYCRACGHAFRKPERRLARRTREFAADSARLQRRSSR